MGQAQRVSRLMAWIAVFSLATAISGCAMTASPASSPSVNAGATATAAIAATPTPHPIAAFTCAAGSLPILEATTRTSCSVSTQSGVQVLLATYAGASGTATRVDENALATAGWQVLMMGHGDGVYSSVETAVFAYQSAWFAYERIARSDGTFTLNVKTSVPSDNAPIACGQAAVAGSTQLGSIELPAGSVTVWTGDEFAAPAAVVPACVAEIAHFYETLLPAAGWHIDTPFISTSRDPNLDPTQHKSAVFTRGSTQLSIALAGHLGALTCITIQMSAS